MRAAALLVASFALALTASGPAAATAGEIIELEQAPVRLVYPDHGATLPGGAWFELAWEPAAGFDALASAEEWEMFLSLDGGATFPVRLTPHIDLALRHVSFEVPNLPSDEVRLLFRYGDEARERAFRLPGRFRIRAGNAAAAMPAALGALRPPGEPALVGAAGVALWSDGARDGSRREARAAGLRIPAVSGRPTIDAGAARDLRAVESAAKELAPPAPRSTKFLPSTLASPAGRPLAAAARNTDLLLLLSRRNE